jgi:tRNA-2-methylthio-N6-dimethylallyladenosine synthase
MRTYCIETWGCQMNQHDSELIEGQLLRQGMRRASDATEADLVILNTCAVRERPVHKITSRIGALEKLPRPPVIGVCGCVAQQEGVSLLDRSKRVGFVLGPGDIGRLGEAIRAVEQGERPLLIGFDPDREHDFELHFRSSPTRGMVTVVEGCNEFCTFCVVPYTRGRELSRPMSDILREVRSLAASGLKEIELLGQTINSYCCPRSGHDFSILLKTVAAIPELERVRFVTSHPRHFHQHLIDTLAANTKVSRYLHLPFQAGSDRILDRMHRRTTRAEYLDLVRRIRQAVPDINLSTDVIVGFPGETEDDFECTLGVLEEVLFGQVFAFAFSPRPRTPAARYGGRVPEPEKKLRLQRLFELSDRISLELNQQLVGSVVRVLIDGDSRRDRQAWQGRAEDNRIVNFAKTGRESVGEIVEVRLTRAGPHSLVGERPSGGFSLPVLATVDGAA